MRRRSSRAIHAWSSAWYPGTRKWKETEEFNKQLPCVKSGAKEKDCFLAKGGQIVTVTQLK